MAIDWIFKYRPNSIEEMALYPALKDRLNLYYQEGEYGHLIFAGGWGTGKTTAAHILGEKHPNDFAEFDCAGKNTKTELQKIITGSFSVSLMGSKRVILLDEFHNIKTNEQTIFNVPMEKNYNQSIYILAVNDIDKVNPAIVSRSTILNFDIGTLSKKTHKLTINPYTGITKDKWIKELKRVTNIVADKAGAIISNKSFNAVLSTDAYLIDVRSFIRAVNEQIKIDAMNC